MMDSFLFELYHENSKLSLWEWEQLASIRHINESGQLGLLADAPTIDIRCLKQTRLPKPALPDLSLQEALERRRSTLKFERGELLLKDLSSLLHFSCGLNGSLYEGGTPRKALRFCPSPGGLYPLTILVEARYINQLTPGVYCYDADRHALGMIESDLDALSAATTQSDAPLDCACRFWLFCRFDRLSFKYGERSYRFALLEAGHVAQNILLIAAAMSIPARPFAGFLDDLVSQAVKSDCFGLVPLYFVGVGGKS